MLGGFHRVIWPALELQKLGHDVRIIRPSERSIRLLTDRHTGRPVKIDMPEDADVVLMQRMTNRLMVQSIPLIREKGVAVIVDVDDDLTAIHPDNPAYRALHPRNENTARSNGQINYHSWHHLTEACREATMVTVSTPALLDKYARHGRGRVLYNYLAEHYYNVEHVDSTVVGWPASLHSHPNDPADVGNAIARFVNSGGEFRVLSKSEGVGREFGLSENPQGVAAGIGIFQWPAAVAELGIGIAPLVDTKFNSAKSWLKPLELSATGVPWVASPRTEYVRLHEMGAGILADHPRRWYKALRELADSEVRRKELSDAGRAAAEQLRLRDHAWRWWELFEDALTLQRQKI